ncbi:MAG: S41 family peptidase [Pseudomonadota bacterium]
MKRIVSGRRATMLASVIATTCLAACGGGGANAPAPDVDAQAGSCSNDEQKQFVLDVMQDIYFWVDDLDSNINIDAFDSPEALLEELVSVQPLDRFSFIGSAAADDAFFSDSQFIGVGLGLSTRGDQVFITQVFGDGPAAATGLGRGDELLRINGIDVADALAGDGIGAAFGDDEIGVMVELRARRTATGEITDDVLFKDLVTIEPIPASAVLDVDGEPVGYVVFRDFVNPAFDELERVFGDFAAAGVTQLILDLRYNGGGLISVSEFLGDLLAGGLAGSTYYSREHNDANTDFNFSVDFVNQANALTLDNLIIITTGGTASASELVINGISPYRQLTLVGETTFGKPIGQYGYEFCEKILRPASFVLANSLGNSDYYDGFAPDCAATDDLTRALGDPEEAMLAEALDVVRNGTCTTPFAKAADAQAAKAAAAAAVAPPPRGREVAREIGDAY